MATILYGQTQQGLQEKIKILQKEIEIIRQQRLQMEPMYADIIARGGPDLRPKGPDVPVLERQKQIDYLTSYLNEFKSKTEQGTATDKPVNTVQPQATQNESVAPPASYSSIQAVGPVEPAKEEELDFTGVQSDTPALTKSPESVKNLSIVENQAASGSEEAQAFLNQYKETSLNNIPQETETLIASSDTPQKPSGPSTPVKYDPVMKQYVPNVEPGKVLLEILKQAKTGPRGEAVAQSQFGPRGEDIAQILPLDPLPSGPRGMERAPGTNNPRNIMPLQTPGSKWRPGEGWMIQNPFNRSPQTGPGLSQNQEEETKPEFDKQRALVASKAADEYRRSSQSEDPFRTPAFG
jgi:hypothetical protein